MTRAPFAVVLAVLALGATTARADEPVACDATMAQWVARCATAHDVSMTVVSCPVGLAIVEVAPRDGPALRVELGRSQQALRTIGGVSLTPIGDFPDWKREPPSRRGAFDALAECVAREAPPSLPAASLAATSRVAGARIPVLPILAGLLALVACLLDRRPTLRRRGIVGLGLALGLAATLLVRAWLQPLAFFHQNGQGFDWIILALRGEAGEYGPGYPELYGWLATRSDRPDRAILALQGLLAATVPASAWLIARSVGAARATAWLVAAALAVDPILARIARSESYFATYGALLFLAAASLSATPRCPRTRPQRLRQGLGVLVAGLLVAQAARVHPLAWVPSALVPLVLVCRRGPVRRRWTEAAIAALAIGLVAAPLVVPSMRVTLAGGLGRGFLPGARALVAESGHLLWMLPLAAALLSLGSRTRRVSGPLLVVALVLSAGRASDVLRMDLATVRAASLHALLPAGLAAALALTRRWPVTSLVTAVVAVAHLLQERPVVTPPTDARELAFAWEWRETLAPGAQVAALQRVDKRVLTLPLLGKGLPASVPLTSAGTAAFVPGGPRFYLRTSLCSTPEGAPICAQFEARHRLRRVTARTFPATASLPWLPLSRGSIETVLFAVEGSG